MISGASVLRGVAVCSGLCQEAGVIFYGGSLDPLERTTTAKDQEGPMASVTSLTPICAAAALHLVLKKPVLA